MLQVEHIVRIYGFCAETSDSGPIFAVHVAVKFFDLLAFAFEVKKARYHTGIVRTMLVLPATQRGTAIFFYPTGMTIIGRTLSTDLSGKEARRSEGQLGEHA